jgi:DNA-binding NarL/FixJ family response regulator
VVSHPVAGTQVLVVDDNEFNRAGVALYLQSLGYDILEAGDEAEALDQARRKRPAAAIVDIVIPPAAGDKAQTAHSIGLRLVASLKALDPALAVVVFSAHEDRGEEVLNLIRDGVRGIAYLLKGIRPEKLAEALQETAAGRVILDDELATGRPKLADEIRNRLTPAERQWVDQAVMLMGDLTETEMKVAVRVAASQNTQGIAAAMGRSTKTIEAHISSVYERLGLNKVDERAVGLRKSSLLAKACQIYELLGGGKE